MNRSIHKPMAALMVALVLCIACSTTPPSTATEPALERPTEAEMSPTSIAQRFVSHMVEGREAEARAMFTVQMAEAIGPTKLDALWDSLQDHMGTFTAIVATRAQEHSSKGLTVVWLTATFAQGEQIDIQLAIDADHNVSGLFFKPIAQAWKPAEGMVNREMFTETDLVFGQAPWVLPGTLSLPVGDGSWPGVVLVHGSGAHDRDETIGPNKPFKDIAWALASQGIAVLRYDKRNHALPQEVAARPPFTIADEVLDDAAAALAWMAQQPHIDPRRLVVLGHSHGAGLLFRIVAQASTPVAGAIALAAPGRPLEEMMVAQITYISQLEGTAATPAMVAEFTAAREKVKQLTDADRSDTETVLFGAHPAWWLDMRGFDPATELARVPRTLPLLFLQGERDYQVTPTDDFARWQALTQERSNATTILFPGLSHLFIAGEGPPTPDTYRQPGHVAPEVIAALVSWLNAR